MRAILVIGYLALGVVQFFAIIAGLQEMGVHWMLSGIVAMFITYIPILGTAAGVYGAITAWGFTLLQALALFFGPLAVFAVFAFVMAGAESVSDWRRRRAAR